jgi:hypothetical protein
LTSDFSSTFILWLTIPSHSSSSKTSTVKFKSRSHGATIPTSIKSSEGTFDTGDGLQHHTSLAECISQNITSSDVVHASSIPDQLDSLVESLNLSTAILGVAPTSRQVLPQEYDYPTELIYQSNTSYTGATSYEVPQEFTYSMTRFAYEDTGHLQPFCHQAHPTLDAGAIQAHTASMTAYLEAFDAIFNEE